MRIHLIKRQSIEDFAKANARSRTSFEDWLEKLKQAQWRTPADIKTTFGKADLLGRKSNRVVFDIGGNNYRMICKYVFGDRKVHLFICWIGTHDEYDKLNGNNMQYMVNNF